MKKKGFTLIELLAVIVVLAIIALIATPIVMNAIEKARRGAAERTAGNYVDAVETAVATERLEGNILEGTYTINDKGNLEGNGLTEPLVIEMNGNKPTSGTITIKDGQVQTSSTMIIGDYNVSYDSIKKNWVATKIDSKSIICKASTSLSNVKKGYSFVTDYSSSDYNYYGRLDGTPVGYLAKDKGAYEYGVEYKCTLGDSDDTKDLVFYVLETNGDNVSLLSASTMGNQVAWVSYSDYIAAGGTAAEWSNGNQVKYGALTANKELDRVTENWTKLTDSQISLPKVAQFSDYDLGFNSGISVGLGGFWLGDQSADLSSAVRGVLVNYVGWIGYIQDMQADGGQNCYNEQSCYYTYNYIRPVITLSKTQLG